MIKSDAWHICNRTCFDALQKFHTQSAVYPAGMHGCTAKRYRKCPKTVASSAYECTESSYKQAEKLVSMVKSGQTPTENTAANVSKQHGRSRRDKAHRLNVTILPFFSPIVKPQIRLLFRLLPAVNSQSKFHSGSKVWNLH